MKKILLLFVLFLGLNAGAFAASEIQLTKSDDSPHRATWIHVTHADGTSTCVDDGHPCTHYFNEPVEGVYEYDGSFCG